ncbi:2-hydroxyacyl-CoA dehydratase family protein [Sphingosinicella sp. BN140058]|uniref:2-hydroxyacyl-CoA dehydratase family protein n=1 Tax=Sphingosinicella sp. BN140058 TaxID=1892855 RepID=UPI00101259EF|nr:2-hydroxyacyl-CoA dehydratase family protein [Sphingosinicella sp. BN140058]QAY75286.1 2-hydroxyacyl-CoA dehydratase [Sphingosinicella sp. BN140058]
MFERFTCAYDDPATVIAAADRPVVRTLGVDAPRELLLAAGVLPVRLVAPAGLATPRADAWMGDTAMGPRGKRLLEQILDPAHRDVPLLITHADSEQPQIFAALRELARLGESVPRHIHFLDLLHLDRDSSRRYNRRRLDQCVAWLEMIGGGSVSPESIERALEDAARQRSLFARLAGLRRERRIAGTDMLRIAGAASILPPAQYEAALSDLLGATDALPPLVGKPVFVTGSPHEHAALYALIEASGAIIVGEDHGWGAPLLDPIAPAPTLDGLTDPRLRVVARATPPASRARALAERLAESGAELLLHITIDEDEAAPWDIAAIRRAMPDAPFVALRTPSDGSPDFARQIGRVLAGAPLHGAAPTAAEPAPKAAAGARSRKSLESVATFGRYQRDWFASVRAQVAEGAPFAIVNANAPQEILRAFDMPFVINQWWASIVAAKQQSSRYSALLAARDFPTDVEAYSAQGLAAAFDEDPDAAPWGGLPKPDFVHAILSSDPAGKIFREWADATGATPFLYERTIDPRSDITIRWWEDLPERWADVLEPERIDLMVAELETVIAAVESGTGRRFSGARFAEVMTLVNEQEEYYRRTRDLIATTIPAPISIVDSMPATMVPQWHRGTIWARDAAKAFYEEVAARVENGLAAVPHERVRLMWVGRGLWSEMGFYQKWEESHGAVFVWSMYLALAADGYIRTLEGGRDPMRALAARFMTMGDELRMPTWAGPWNVREAQSHQVDGVVALRDADPFVIRALRDAGFPVLQLSVDNFSREGADMEGIEADVTAFIEGEAGRRARSRIGGADVRA